jgi:tRNA A-37 threonylcarbamoyl transferase component Bud32
MILKDRYAIEKELGRGGIGVVYLARDTQLHAKPVVIKVLLEAVEDSEDSAWFKKKFRQEIEALSRLNHPSIVGVLDAGETPDGRLFIVMEFVAGVTLRSVLTSEGLRLAHAAQIVRQISHALSAAHDRGIFHRDLKPENIMLQDLGEGEELVKLIDFGIATVPDSQIAANADVTQVAGTLPYMAPEQLMGKPSAASDIYALAVIAYEMVTGRLPFQARLSAQRYQMQQAGVKVKPADLRPDLPAAAQDVILKALAFEPKDRYPRARDFGEALARALTAKAGDAPPPVAPTEISAPEAVRKTRGITSTAPAEAPPLAAMRIALLYKRHASPDEQLLKLLERQLAARGHQVFVDRHLAIGVEWAKEIEREVRTADVVIPLLSAASVSSEMLAYEVQIAHEAAQAQQGKPRLLPVRVSYDGPLPEPLAGILDPIQYSLWRGPQDNSRVVAELLNGLVTAPVTQAIVRQPKLEPVGGAVPLDSEFYLVRAADEEFRAAIARRDSIVLVKGARQMGKTSLLARGLQQARAAGARVVLTDFQKLNTAHLESVESLFLTLAELIADQLDLDVLPDQTWTPRRGPSMNFERHIRREVLGKLTSPLVWGLDEVDRLFTCSFGSEVFGLFRSWHNERSLDPEGPWQRLTLAIAYATEAHLFITDLNQSPFNVGTRLTLEDFTFEQVAELNRRYGAPLREAAEVARYFRLVGGHPYLVRRGLHEMASHGLGLAAFEAQADRDEGPFGDHLRRILILLAQDAALCEVVRGVLRGRPCPTPESFYRLRAAGLMAGDAAREVRPRCQLYATYLERHLL